MSSASAAAELRFRSLHLRLSSSSRLRLHLPLIRLRFGAFADLELPVNNDIMAQRTCALALARSHRGSFVLQKMQFGGFLCCSEPNRFLVQNVLTSARALKVPIEAQKKPVPQKKFCRNVWGARAGSGFWF